MGRAARGVTGLKLKANDELTSAVCVDESRNMLFITSGGSGKQLKFSEFMQHGRATGGQLCYKVSEKTGEIIGAVSVAENDEIVCITSQGKTIRSKISEISVQGRNASGVRVLDIQEPDMVIAMDRVDPEEEIDEE